MFFEPTRHFYAGLESGEDTDLGSAARQIGAYLELDMLPAVGYEWGLRMDPNVAGQIRLQRGLRSHIQIPLFYVGKPHALGAILAHELTHELLACKGIVCSDKNENEQLTDLASIVAGLGKLVLNGMVTDMGTSASANETLGYLSPYLKAYAYKKFSLEHAISDQEVRENLNVYALHVLHSHS